MYQPHDMNSIRGRPSKEVSDRLLITLQKLKLLSKFDDYNQSLIGDIEISQNHVTM